MGVPSAETALLLYQTILYWLAYVLVGAGLLAVGVYVVLVLSETLVPEIRSKAGDLSAATAQATHGVSGKVLEIPGPQPPAIPQVLPRPQARKPA